jgi:lysophospholipase L1-like esterase
MRLLRLVLINFAVLCSLAVVALIALDVALRISDQRLSSMDRKRSAVPNYAGAEWPLTHFREAERLVTEYFSFVGWRRGLFQGETINVVGRFHERLTAQAEGARGGAVFFFGGSAMWGTGARDHETIPSYYSRLAGRPTRNFGESGYVAHQNLEMLLWVLQEGERPVAVVFYDGVNDVMHRCRAGSSGFAHSQEGRMRSLLTQQHGILLRLWALLEARLAQQADGPDAEARFDCDDDPAKARAVADALLRDWRLTRVIAEAEGIDFFPVLQPVVYFSDTIADRRADSGKGGEAEKRAQFEAVYPLVRQGLAKLGAADLTGALDGQEYVYVDYCHLSPNGNERVARAMAALVEPRLAEKE